MSTTHQEIDAAARELIAEVGLPADFIAGLGEGDDWSFIVKLHALIEAAMTHALVVHVAKEDAREIFANLELNNSKTGKIAFAGLFLRLESDDRRFLRSFSELRNNFVHDVRMVSIDLNTYFAGLTTDKKRIFMKALGYTEPEHGEKPQELDALIVKHCKNVRLVIWRAASFLLAVLQLQCQAERAAQETTRIRLELLGLVRSNKLYWDPSHKSEV